MDKFEKQFEDLDVQSAAMDSAMSNTTTLTVPQVNYINIANLELPSSNAHIWLTSLMFLCFLKFVFLYFVLLFIMSDYFLGSS